MYVKVRVSGKFPMIILQKAMSAIFCVFRERRNMISKTVQARGGQREAWSVDPTTPTITLQGKISL